MNQVKAFVLLAALLFLYGETAAVLPQQLKSARLTDSTTASQIDDKIGEVESAIADILGIPIDTNITAPLFTAVAGGIGSVNLVGTTVANLPAAGTAGRIRMITDGDAANMIVIDDGTNWEDLQFLRGIHINIAAPRYNADGDNAENNDEIQAAIDTHVARVGGGGASPIPCLFTPPRIYTTTAELLWDTGGGSLLACIYGVPNYSQIRGNFAGDSLIAFNEATSATLPGNGVWIWNMIFSATGGTGPDALLQFNRIAQGHIGPNVALKRPHLYMLQFAGAINQHWLIHGIIVTENNLAAQANGAAFYFDGPIADMKVTDVTCEGSFSASTFTMFLSSTTLLEALHVSGVDCQGGSGWGTFANLDAQCAGCTFEKIDFENLNTAGIIMNPTPAATIDDEPTVISKVNFVERSGATATNGIKLVKMGNVSIRDAFLDGFDEGLYVENSFGVVADTVTIRNSVTCLREVSGNAFNIFGPISCEATTRGMNQTGSASGGNNIHKGWTFTGTHPTTAYWDSPGLGQKDRIILADVAADSTAVANSYTCVNSGDGNPAALTIFDGTGITTNNDWPFLRNVIITNTADGDGCSVTLGTTQAFRGMEITVVAETGGTAPFTVDGITFTTTQSVGMRFNGTAWVQVF